MNCRSPGEPEGFLLLGSPGFRTRLFTFGEWRGLGCGTAVPRNFARRWAPMLPAGISSRRLTWPRKHFRTVLAHARSACRQGPHGGGKGLSIAFDGCSASDESDGSAQCNHLRKIIHHENVFCQESYGIKKHSQVLRVIGREFLSLCCAFFLREQAQQVNSVENEWHDIHRDEGAVKSRRVTCHFFRYAGREHKH